MMKNQAYLIKEPGGGANNCVTFPKNTEIVILKRNYSARNLVLSSANVRTSLLMGIGSLKSILSYQELAPQQPLWVASKPIQDQRFSVNMHLVQTILLQEEVSHTRIL